MAPLAMWLHLALLALGVVNAFLLVLLHYHMVEAILDHYDPGRQGEPWIKEPPGNQE